MCRVCDEEVVDVQVQVMAVQLVDEGLVETPPPLDTRNQSQENTKSNRRDIMIHDGGWSMGDQHGLSSLVGVIFVDFHT